ncbi:MAG: aminomethyl-transferring glycine dehydrogenase subunit GcvPA [Bacteroidales bacterium]|nr:aminomethyl-transferring glycine dehydrogenase subunit GcvPA [Bacteroidales bacterium]
MFPYFPHTEEDIKAMLERCGVSSLEELYSDLPEKILYRKDYDLPDAMSEQEVRDFFASLDKKNKSLKIFVGYGAYDHYVPSAVSSIASRSEFLTAYTPYQAEISQGTLRYIFEYQSMICSLTGMDVANASMYDGGTSAAEALLMCAASTRKRSRVLVSAGLLPQILEVVRTYCFYHGLQLDSIDCPDGQTSLEQMNEKLASGDVAGVLVPGINRFGIIEDLAGFADSVHSAGALLAVYSDPSTLAVLKTPAQWGADICCGEAQSLGIPLSWGGPYLGFLACRKEYMRKLPGRIVGQTTDLDGKRAFVLTLQAREQHIRREKATSNICSNQSLMALWVTIYMSLMGPAGLREVCDKSYGAAHYLKDALVRTGKFSEAFPGKPFLQEFVLRSDLDPAALQKALVGAGFFAAYRTQEGLYSFCATEQSSKADIDALVKVIENI